MGYNTHRPLNPDEFRGFVLIDEYAPLIFVNSVDALAAQSFTLSHEFVHVLLGSSDVSREEDFLLKNNAGEEGFCNRVAAEFLLPKFLAVKLTSAKELPCSQTGDAKFTTHSTP